MIIIYYPYPHYHQQSRKGLEFTFLFGGREMPLFLKTGKSLGTVLRAYSSSHLEGRGKRITGIQELRDNPGQLNLERTNEWNIKKIGGLGPSAFHREPGGCLTLHSHSLLRIMTFQSWKRFFWNIWPTSSQYHKIQTRVPMRERVMLVILRILGERRVLQISQLPPSPGLFLLLASFFLCLTGSFYLQNPFSNLRSINRGKKGHSCLL